MRCDDDAFLGIETIAFVFEMVNHDILQFQIANENITLSHISMLVD